MTEIQRKVQQVRRCLEDNHLAAIRFRCSDWFSWATAGASNVVLLTSELGVAEVLISRDKAFVLTDAIEFDRLRSEFRWDTFELVNLPWADTTRKNELIADVTLGGRIASDRPLDNEEPLPQTLRRQRLRLCDEELSRYQSVGKDAAQAATEVLSAAQPDSTEHQLAGAAASALWKRGLHPALTLVGGSSRVDLHRHPTPTSTPLGDRAMLVICARGFGLYANLTRWVYFRAPTSDELKRNEDVARVEARAWRESTPGASLANVFNGIVESYNQLGYPQEQFNHHQGGPTGYLGREEIATSKSDTQICEFTALAWNPSVRGAKIEDTVFVDKAGVKILTEDPGWPSFFEVDGRKRPGLLVKP